jgi:hypothetical protein
LEKAFRITGLLQKVNPTVWSTEFNGNCQAVGSGPSSLKYLAPNVFRISISNHRIRNIESHQLTFRYLKPNSRQLRTSTLDALEFICRFLLLRLPSGFMKNRHSGFLSKSYSVSSPIFVRLCESELTPLRLECPSLKT